MGWICWRTGIDDSGKGFASYGTGTRKTRLLDQDAWNIQELLGLIGKGRVPALEGRIRKE